LWRGEDIVKLPGGLSQTDRDEGSGEAAVPSLLMVQATHLAIQWYRVQEEQKHGNY